MKIKLFSDDGWVFVTVVTILLGVFLGLVCNNPVLFIIGFALGSLYEQIIEYLAHGWLQHKRIGVFDYFVARHTRHHAESQKHHALQSIPTTFFVTILLLSPFIFTVIYSTIGKDISLGIMAGFLVTHALLNVLHYDVHAPKKIIPEILRNTKYYKSVSYYHILHHQNHRKGIDNRIYGVTNPWLDMFLHKIGISNFVDKWYDRLGGRLQNKVIVTAVSYLIRLLDASDFYDNKEEYL